MTHILILLGVKNIAELFVNIIVAYFVLVNSIVLATGFTSPFAIVLGNIVVHMMFIIAGTNLYRALNGIQTKQNLIMFAITMTLTLGMPIWHKYVADLLVGTMLFAFP